MLRKTAWKSFSSPGAGLLRGAHQAIRWTRVSVNIGLKQLASTILDASLDTRLTFDYVLNRTNNR